MTESTQVRIQLFIDYLKFQKRYSPHTVRSYRDDLLQFFDYVRETFDSIAINGISHNHVRSWLASLKENDISSKTINRKISALKSFFKYLMRTGALEQTPL